jgi:hypothetical protein
MTFEYTNKLYKEASRGIDPGWLENDDGKWFEYIISLPKDLQLTYTLVVFNNQVLNGGFRQYFINGYGQFCFGTVEHLRNIGAMATAVLLQKAILLINRNNFPAKTFRDKLLSGEFHELFERDLLYEPLHDLDKSYYTGTEEIPVLLEEYLTKGRS